MIRLITPYKGRKIDFSKKVKIYRNLHARGKPGMRWSIKQGHQVVAHTDLAIITNVDFEVNQKGYERVIKYGKKVVHAYAVGYLMKWVTDDDSLRFRVLYDPWKNNAFETPSGMIVEAASMAILSPLGIRVKFPRFRKTEI